MPKPKSGSEVSAKTPESPKQPAKVDPGEQAKAKAEQAQLESGQTDSTKVGQRRSNQGSSSGGQQEEQPSKTWFEFQVLDATGAPMKDVSVALKWQNGKSETRRTDNNGVIRLENEDPSTKISAELVDHDDKTWAPLGPGNRRTPTNP